MLKDFFKKKKYATITFEEREKPSKIKNIRPIGYSSPEKIEEIKKETIKIEPRKRIEDLLDEGSFIEYDADLETSNPLDFPEYMEKIRISMEKSGEKDAVITGEGQINGQETVICVMNSNFMMGSMGSVVGEKITRAIEKAIEKSFPLIIFTASGGARMQEGILSLMQMAKTSQAVAKLGEAGLLYIAVLTHPTTGGVTASFAMLGDIILAEPDALICFAGPRVIEQTINQKLPQGFQRAEFLLEKGFIDEIVPRENMRDYLSQVLKCHKGGEFHD